MEKPDLSVAAPENPQEQPLNQAAPQTADAAESTVNECQTAESPAPIVDPEAAAEEEMTEAIEQEQVVEQATAPTKESLILQAEEMLKVDAAELQREQITHLRQRFAMLRRVEVDEARTRWAEEGNDPEAFQAPEDPDEVKFNDIVSQIREKKNVWAAQQEEQRQANLKAKNDIIDQINALAEDTDNVNRTFPLYRELQDRFKTIGEVPPMDETSVWKRFQEARERYSDNLKINKELRDYDFKINLDTKQLLISEAEALDAEPDVIVAFRRLQELHDKWRQAGPVAKELREEIWTKFKEASAVINKKYQTFFEERKAREAENEEAKNALCAEIESLDFGALTTFAHWEEMTKTILDLQNRWKELGFASRKVNNQLFARFRQRCDEFFVAKAAYFKGVKEEYAANLAKKIALAEKAEQLMESTEWRKATDALVALQKEWKTIGAVPKKHSDAVWKRFLAACDTFFDRKKAALSGHRAEEQANLKTKREIIEAVKALIVDGELAAEAANALGDLQDKWQQTGHVPFKEKDKINEAYRTALNEVRRKLNASDNKVRMERFETNLSQIEGDANKLLRERERLMRALESRQIEIRTYENNLGFLSSKSKSGESMVSEFRRKIDKLKEDIASIEDKIRLIDTKL